MKFTKADKEWKLQIMQPTCEVCGSRVLLDPHHYIYRSQSSELRTNIRNGVCLCRYPCHYKAHTDKKWFSDWMQKNRPADKAHCDNKLKEQNLIKKGV